MGTINRRRIVKACRGNRLTWRFMLNSVPTMSWKLGGGPISGEALEVLRRLDRDGVASTSVDALLGEDSCYSELAEAVESLERVELADEIALRRAISNDNRQIGQKTFILPLLGDHPRLDPDLVYARFALQKPILRIANAYFGMYTRLRYYNVWHTFASGSEPRESQLWHFDREDYHILKVFLYLSEVDRGAGPFTYVAGSHPKGKMRRTPEYSLEGNVRRSSDEQMSAIAGPEKWVTCTGRKGTLVFADTRGYHKGGLARERDRLIYTCMFTSPASESEEFFDRPDFVLRASDVELAFALAEPRRRGRRGTPALNEPANGGRPAAQPPGGRASRHGET